METWTPEQFKTYAKGVVRGAKMRRKQPEAALQKAVIEHIHKKAPDALVFAVPNGGKRNAREAAIMKGMGVMPGVADLLIFWQGRREIYPGFGAIELKIDKGKQSPSQEAFEKSWTALGGKYALCRSIDDADDILLGWGIV